MQNKKVVDNNTSILIIIVFRNVTTYSTYNKRDC